MHDAGDASDTEIWHVAYLRPRTSIAITPRARSCRIWGLPRGQRESGGKLSRPQTGYRLEREQLQCQTRLALRAECRDSPRLLTCANRAAGIPANEMELTHGERRSDILYQALFGVDIQVVSI